MRRWTGVLGAAIVAAATVLLVRLTATGEKIAASPAPPKPPGVAVVIDAERAPEARLPDLDDLQADPGAVAQTYRDAGLRVAADPTGRCLAVTAPARISDDDLLSGADLPDPVLAAGIWERMTPEQMAAREKGYLRATKLSKVQRAAADRIARRHGMIDEKGRVIEHGLEAGHLAFGTWVTWVPHVTTLQEGEFICRSLIYLQRPPTEPAVAEPPLPGDVLWWAWPHAQASWGEKPVTVEAGTYALADLLRQMAQSAGLEIRAQAEITSRRFAVLTSEIPVRTLLWALAVASGLEVEAAPNSAPSNIFVTPREETYRADKNVLLPMAGLGYYSPADSDRGREMLARLEGGPTDERKNWIGWRLSDLPLLYRNWIEENWQREIKSSGSEPPPPLDPERTIMLWTKASYLSVDIQLEDGSGGGGPPFLLPAL